jgi:hypothetical protein
MTDGRPFANRQARGRRWAMVAVLLLGFFLRVHRIGEQRVWWDEGWSVWAARFSALDILRQTGNDVHPPLYFELLHLWRVFSGDGEAGLRLLSAFVGLLAVTLTYALGRRLARGSLSPGRASMAGVLAALFLVVSRFAVAWSQEIRMYALASLLAALAVWAARRVWDRGLRRDMILYILATTAGLYTLYLFAPVWIAINVAWLWVLRDSADRRRELSRWTGLQLLIMALFLPWAIYAAGGFLSTAAATPIRLIDFLHIYWTVLTVGIPVDVAQFNRLTMPAAVIFLFAVVALVISVVRRQAGDHGLWPPARAPRAMTSISSNDVSSLVARHSSLVTRRDLTLLLAVLLLPAAIVYVVSLPKQNFYNPPFNPRYLVIFTPFYSILLAWGLATVGELLARGGAGKRESKGEFAGGRRPAAGGLLAFLLAAFMIAVSLVGLQPYHPGRVLIDDYPSLVSTIDAYRRPGDAVILYSDTDWPIFAYHHPEPWRGMPHLWTITTETAADFLAPIWDAHDAVWLVTTPYSAGGDPQRHIPAWLAGRATAVREFAYKDMALTLYTRTPERAAAADQLTGSGPANRVDVPLPGVGRLIGYDQAAHDFKSGDIIHLFLYRQSGDAGRTEIGLIDDTLSDVWQPTSVEWPAAADIARQQVDIIVPPEAPSGDYRFYVISDELETVPFGRLTVSRKQTPFLTMDDVTVPNRVDAPFGDAIRLLGYDLATESAPPGGSVELTLFWSSDGDVRQRYKVFTHLLGHVFNAESGNFLWGQVDSEPAANTRPTTTWRGAEVIVDEYAIPVAAGAPPGVYRIEIGLYDSLSGDRLPLLGEDGNPAADHLILGAIEITP